MFDPIFTLTRQQIRDRVALVKQMDLHNTLYERKSTGNYLRDGFDPSNRYHATVYFLLDEFSQRLRNIDHHLGWADKFEEGDNPNVGTNNVIQAAVALVQVE